MATNTDPPPDAVHRYTALHSTVEPAFAETEWLMFVWDVSANMRPDTPMVLRVIRDGEHHAEIVVTAGTRLIADADGVRTEPIDIHEE